MAGSEAGSESVAVLTFIFGFSLWAPLSCALGLLAWWCGGGDPPGSEVCVAGLCASCVLSMHSSLSGPIVL